MRIACALVLASQLVLVALLLELTGRTAILFSFVGTPLLGVAVFLVVLSWLRNEEGSLEGVEVHRDASDRPGGPAARRDG